MELMALITPIFILVLVLILLVLSRINNERKWSRIEKLNENVGINRHSAYIDGRGYLRWKGDKKLCHRDIVYDVEIGEGNRLPNFGNMDVHHKDGNKFNNNPDNLEILSREKHQEKHGRLVVFNGKKMMRLCAVSKINHSTEKAFLVARRWIPKSLTTIHDGFLYIEYWLYKVRFGGR